MKRQEELVYSILRICMVLLILVTAYFLPKICIQEQIQEEKGVEQAADNAGQEADGKANGDGSQDLENSVEQAEREETVRNEKSGSKGLILLDPGHGGSDPGMVGIGGIEEKIINLQVAFALGALLEEADFQVAYTRTEDTGLYDAETANKKAQDMQRRCKLIAEKDPVLTVSIHQNSYSDPEVYGPQVFYFEHSAEGEKLAACIQESLNQKLAIAKPRQIKGNTNYYILKRSEGTTVLVECSFLSNPQEAQKIQTAEYQAAAAEAIRDGILAYLGEKGGKR